MLAFIKVTLSKSYGFCFCIKQNLLWPHFPHQIPTPFICSSSLQNSWKEYNFSLNFISSHSLSSYVQSGFFSFPHPNSASIKMTGDFIYQHLWRTISAPSPLIPFLPLTLYPLLHRTSQVMRWVPSFVLFIFRATPSAYGSSQARGEMGAAATGLHHSN